VLLAAAPCRGADEIRPPFEVELRAAVMAYREGEMDKAREHTAKALAMLDEMKAGTITATLPDAPDGWKAGEIRKEKLPDFLGGGRTLKRTYEEEDGDKKIELEVIFDSQLGKMLMGLMANDAIAEAQGFKVRRIGRERALIKPAGGGLELNLPIEEKLLVKLTGKGGTEEKDLLEMAREVDRGTLRELE
jgi:hypothetical protein